jgi:hypothetical protein
MNMASRAGVGMLPYQATGHRGSRDRVAEQHGRVSRAGVVARHEAGRQGSRQAVAGGLGRGALGRARSSDEVVAPAGGAA